MKIFVTSIGERTTMLTCWQLKRLGFEVVLLLDNESWPDKYARFINMAVQHNKPCLRVDADVICNQELFNYSNEYNLITLKRPLMVQFHTYDLYRNSIGITSPVLYSRKALKIIQANLTNISQDRPEATAWRLPEINPYTVTSPLVVGFHGFYQDGKTLARAKENKKMRQQDHLYDWPLVDEIMKMK